MSNRETRVDKAKAMLVEQVTDLLQSDEVGDWIKPWQALATQFPTNATTGHRYSGGNAFLFHIVAQANGWVGRYATYKQWQSKDCQVRKGETGLPGLFAKLVVKNRGTDDEERFFVARGFTVFAAEQVDGEFAEELVTEIGGRPQLPDGAENEQAIAFVERLTKIEGVDVKFGGARAFYRPSTDSITLPSYDLYDHGTEVEFAATAGHEFVHWTGHADREDRFSDSAAGSESLHFGSQTYAQEELVAELGSIFLLAEHGLQPTPSTNSAAYLKAWLDRLQGEDAADFLWHAASKAQSAVNHINDLLPEAPAALEEAA